MNAAKDKVDFFAAEFLRKLDSLNEENIPFEGYPRDYLLYLMKYKKHYVSIYQRIIGIILENGSTQLSDVIFIDYGSGNGLLAMFASLLPFHRVVAIDVNKDFIEAANQTAAFLSFEKIEFVHGGEDTFVQLETVGKTVVLAGTDVIEHIYDLNAFFHILTHIPKLNVTVFTTASNPDNRRIVKGLMKLQQKEELIGGSADDRVLFGHAHKSFLEMRKEIIRSSRPLFDEQLVAVLAKVSRGYRKDDIEKMLVAYEQDGVVPKEINHPTNTCHPESGSWSERLIEVAEYKMLYETNGFKMAITNGFYDNKKGFFLRRLAIGVLNWIIWAVPSKGRQFAPFIFLTGTKNNAVK